MRSFSIRHFRVRLSSLLLAGLLLFAASPAHAACGSPTGAAGQTIYSADFRNMEYCDGTNWIDMGLATPYIPAAMTFNGTTTYLTRGATFTGAADSQQVSLSFWFRRNGGNGTQQIFISEIAPARFGVILNTSNQIGIFAANSSGTAILAVHGSTAITDTYWHQVIISINMATATCCSTVLMYLDDVAETVTATTYTTNVAIDFTVTNWGIGAEPAGTSKFNGDLADFIFAPGSYSDLTNSTNRRLFISSSLGPVNPGLSCSNIGRLPVCLTGGTASTWYTNSGTGGGMTVNGTLAAAASRPGQLTFANNTSNGYTGTCASPTGPEGQIIFSTAYNLLQYCNGANWIAMGPTGKGGGGCGSPSGTIGQTIFNSAYSVMQYCDGTNWVPMGKLYFPNAVNFDGSTTYLDSSSMSGGIVGGITQWSCSYWIYVYANTTLAYHVLFESTSGNVQMSISNSGSNFNANIYAYDQPGTTRLIDLGSTGVITTGAWHHVLMSWDSLAGTSTIYIDDKNANNGLTWNSGTTWWTSTDDVNGNADIHADMADFWMKAGTYLDFSQVANRRKFRDDSGRPVYLGTEGQLPTGSPADIFLSGSTASWPKNKGTDGGFTLSGTMTTAPTFPP